MDWGIKVHLLESGMSPLPDTMGQLLLRRNLCGINGSNVYVQLRVSMDNQPHRYRWKSVLSFRPPKGTPHVERRAVFETACNLIGARFGADYRVVRGSIEGGTFTWTTA